MIKQRKLIDRRKSLKKVNKKSNLRKGLRRKDEIHIQKQEAALYYSALALGFLIIIVTYTLIIRGLMQ